MDFQWQVQCFLTYNLFLAHVWPHGEALAPTSSPGRAPFLHLIPLLKESCRDLYWALCWSPCALNLLAQSLLNMASLTTAMLMTHHSSSLSPTLPHGLMREYEPIWLTFQHGLLDITWSSTSTSLTGPCYYDSSPSLLMVLSTTVPSPPVVEQTPHYCPFSSLVWRSLQTLPWQTLTLHSSAGRFPIKHHFHVTPVPWYFSTFMLHFYLHLDVVGLYHLF